MVPFVFRVFGVICSNYVFIRGDDNRTYNSRFWIFVTFTGVCPLNHFITMPGVYLTDQSLLSHCRRFCTFSRLTR